MCWLRESSLPGVPGLFGACLNPPSIRARRDRDNLDVLLWHHLNVLSNATGDGRLRHPDNLDALSDAALDDLSALDDQGSPCLPNTHPKHTVRVQLLQD